MFLPLRVHNFFRYVEGHVIPNASQLYECNHKPLLNQITDGYYSSKSWRRPTIFSNWKA